MSKLESGGTTLARQLGLRMRRLSIRRHGLIVVGYLILNLVLSGVGIAFNTSAGTSPWFPTAGLNLALTLIFGLPYALALSLAILIGNLVLNHPPLPLLPILPQALIIALTYGLGAAVLRGRLRIDQRLQQLSDLYRFIVVVSIVPLITGALIVAVYASVGLIPWPIYQLVVLDFWVGDLIGILTVTPFLLVHGVPWAMTLASRRQQTENWLKMIWHWPAGRTVSEILFQVASIPLTLWLVFGDTRGDDIRLYLVFLPLLWIALRHGIQGATISILVINVGAMLAVVGWDIEISIVDLQLFMSALSLTGLFLGTLITERKRAEEALSESEERLRAFGNALPDLAFILDEDGRYVEVLTAQKNLLAASAQQLKGRMIHEMLPSADAELIMATVRRTIDTQQAQVLEYALDVQAGQRWFEGRTWPMRSVSGEARMVVFLARDITERIAAEQALRESEEKYRNLFDYANDSIFIIDRSTRRYIDANENAARRLGYTREELLQLTIDDIEVPMTATQYQTIQHELHETSSVVFEHIQRRKDGTEIEVEISSRIIEYGGRQVYQSHVRDITKRKQVEESLQASYEYLDTILLNLPVGVAILEGPDLRYFKINRKLAEINGLPIEAHLGRPLAEVMPEAGQQIVPEMRKILETGKPILDREFSIALPKDPDKVSYLIDYLFPIMGPDGKPVAIGAVVLDITKRKQAEKQVKASLIEKEVLLKEIHHRVKNNLQLISSLLDLQAEAMHDSRAAEALEQSKSRIQSMAYIHEHLYRSRDMAHVDFAPYLQDLIGHLLYIHGVDPQMIELEINVNDVLLDIDTAIPCGLLIHELASNALKHAFPNGAQGKIKIMLARSESEYMLVVADTGIGFPKDIDFRDTESLGLQLAVTLTDQLDGSIELDRSTGTEFKIRFPVASKE